MSGKSSQCIMPSPMLSGLCALLVGLPPAFAGHPLDEWHERAPLPTSGILQDVDYDGEQYVVLAADSKGRALLSRDLKEWEWQSVGLPEALEPQRIAFNGKRQVIIAGGRVWSRDSWNGEWTESPHFEDPPDELRMLNGEFWAWDTGGYEGALDRIGKTGGRLEAKKSILHRSRDGLTWQVVSTQSVEDTSFGIDDLIYAEGSYVLVNGGQLFHSSDGANWTKVPDSDQKSIRSVAYGSGVFLAGGWVDTGLSEDGKTWSFNEHPFVQKFAERDQTGGYRVVRTEGCQMRLGFSGEQFVAVSEVQGFGSKRAAFSSDGKKWSIPRGSSFHLNRLRQVRDKTFALGDGGSLWVAEPGESDLHQLLPLLPWDWKAVAANSQRVVVGGKDGHVAWSDDAITFNHVLLPDPATVADMVWAPELNRFVAVGGEFRNTKGVSAEARPESNNSREFGRAWTSTNGMDWTTGTLPPDIGRITGVAWDGTTFVLCGYKGQLATSTDGSNWTSRTSGTDELIYDVEWGGGNFVASVFGGQVLTSQDGIRWEIASLGERITSIPGPAPVYGNGTWIIPIAGRVYRSNDLKQWSKVQASDASYPALFAFGEFIATDRRRVVSSSNGLDWTRRTDKSVTQGTVFSYSGFEAATRFRQQIVYVGNGGRIAVSGTWP